MFLDAETTNFLSLTGCKLACHVRTALRQSIAACRIEKNGQSLQAVVLSLLSPMTQAQGCVDSISTCLASTFRSVQTVYISCCSLQDLSMASLHDRPIPSVKVEAAQGNAVKQEDEDVDMPSPYVDDDAEDETPDLDFKRAQQQLWISQVPRELWDIWSKLGDDAEIEIGTLRVEGPDSNPSRASLRALRHRPNTDLVLGQPHAESPTSIRATAQRVHFTTYPNREAEKQDSWPGLCIL